MHVYWNSAWKPSGALAGLLIYKNSSFENHGEEGVGVKSSAFLDGRRVVSIGNALITSAVAQSHAKYLNYVERVRGIRNTSVMGTTKKSLAQTHPALAKEADGWDPTTVRPGSNKSFRWHCISGHVWNSKVCDRVKGSGCPICAGKQVLAGFNDLATVNPGIAAQADGWDPTTVKAGSKMKMQWQCENKHIWQATVSNRSMGNGCPFCSGRTAIIGETDLATTNPELAAQADGWDPTDFTSESISKNAWCCSKGHIFEVII